MVVIEVAMMVVVVLTADRGGDGGGGGSIDCRVDVDAAASLMLRVDS